MVPVCIISLKIFKIFMLFFSKTLSNLQILNNHPRCGLIVTAALQNTFLSSWNLAKSEKQKSLATNQAVQKTIQQIESVWEKKIHNTQTWEHKNSKCSPPAPAALRTGTTDEKRGTPGWAAWRPICSTTEAARSSRALYPSLTTLCSLVPFIVITAHPKRSNVLCQKTTFFFCFFGWDKMLQPARWNLATACLLAVTEFKNSALLSGNVVSLLPDRPNSVVLQMQSSYQQLEL